MLTPPRSPISPRTLIPRGTWTPRKIPTGRPSHDDLPSRRGSHCSTTSADVAGIKYTTTPGPPPWKKDIFADNRPLKPAQPLKPSQWEKLQNTCSLHRTKFLTLAAFCTFASLALALWLNWSCPATTQTKQAATDFIIANIFKPLLGLNIKSLRTCVDDTWCQKPVLVMTELVVHSWTRLCQYKPSSFAQAACETEIGDFITSLAIKETWQSFVDFGLGFLRI